MALQTKIKFINVDKTGRIITVRDTTGFYNATTNPTGYGLPNLRVQDIERIIFTISNYDSKDIYKAEFTSSEIPYPEYPYLTAPTITNITNGENIELTSMNFDITEPTEGIKAFADDIFDFNMYTVFDAVDTVVGNEGDYYITGTGLDKYLVDGLSIYADGEIYTINTNMPTSAGLVLYLTEPLKSDITTFGITYRANTKIFNDSGSDKCLQEATGLLSLEDCGCSDNKQEEAIFRLTMIKILAKLDYTQCDYKNASEKLKLAHKLCKTLKCNCK